MVETNDNILQINKEIIERLEKQNKILTKSKESTFKKNLFKEAKMQKKIQNLTSENEKKQSIIIEREKEIKIQQLKLREFMQKNIQQLPARSFDAIEDIIVSKANKDLQNAVEKDVFGLKQIQQNRRMAGAYRQMRELNSKSQLATYDVDDAISKFISEPIIYDNVSI